MRSSKGLEFRRLDLHVHTAASKCYSGDRNACAKDIVDAALAAGLAGIAITDHNTTKGIEPVRACAKGTPLTVFPGVEITVGDAHTHIVAIFPLDTSDEHIAGLLTTLRLKNGGTEDAYCPCSVEDAINTITSEQFGGLAVLAHSDSSNGVLNEVRGHQRIGIIRNWRLLAVEAKDVAKIRKILDGTDPHYLRKLAVYQASDNLSSTESGKHCAQAVGSRCSYFKVDDRLSLESLRLCFVDPDVRIRQPDEYKPGQPPRIVSMEIESGLFDGETVEFHPGLNCVLGAKGVGKSMLIELLRFALDQPPSIQSVLADHQEKIESKLGLFGRVTVNFIDETGKAYKITRTYNPTETDTIESDEFVRPARVFPIMFLSQNEIVKIAENEDEQLRFIDRFFDVESYRDTIDDIEAELQQWDGELAKCIEAFRKSTEITQKIDALVKEEENLSRQLSSDIFSKYREAESKKAEITRHFNSIGDLHSDLQKEAENWREKKPLDIAPNLKTDPSVKRICKATQDFLDKVTDAIDSLVIEATNAGQAVKAEYEAWKPIYEKTKADYLEHVRKFGGDEKALEVKRKRIADQIHQLRIDQDKVNPVARRLKQVNQDRNSKLEMLFDAYKKRHDERLERCTRFVENSGGRLRINVVESTNAAAFKHELMKMKRGSHLSEKEVAELCEKVKPQDIIWAMIKYHVGQTKSLSELSKATSIKSDRLTVLTDFLIEQFGVAHLLGFQYKAVPEDRPEIYLIQPNKQEVLLRHASVGQKCTAMLLMALCDESMPVIIDQPEDSLDNRTVWDDVCLKLREHKEDRQFILATHNSSLAVASDTDKYVIIEEVSADHATVAVSGAFDNSAVKGEVIKYLEGGQDTYLHKYAKYALPKT